MIPFEQLNQKSVPPQKLQELPFSIKVVLGFIRQFGKNPLSYKLRYYHLLMDYLRLLAVGIVVNNRLETGFYTSQSNTHKRLGQLLVQLGLANAQRDMIHPSELLKDSKSLQLIKEVLRTGKSQVPAELSKPWKQIIQHYFQVLELLGFYREGAVTTHFLKKPIQWKALLAAGTLDYEMRLAETLKELLKLQIGEKIPSPFSEAYYSESGRNAFQNFTRAKFIDVFKNVCQKLSSPPRVLDIGCGYGDYIDAVLEAEDMAQVQGLELQPDLFDELKNRFAETEQVQVSNQNVLSFESAQGYDVVLLNYVLFYLSKEQKLELFHKIAKWLSPGGSVLVCQYYAGIEPLKLELSDRQKDMSLPRYIEMHYANKVLYANALWNETASTFAEAEDWDVFQELLAECGLAIQSLTNADHFYYSLFVELKKV